MNTTTNNKKVSVKEEVSPEMGLTEAEITAGIWNSPPAQKGQGRYLILGKTIDTADFAALKSKEMVSYWDEDFLEECDMFTTSPGWRIHANGLSFLRSKGYQVEIDTIEAQKKREADRIAKKNDEESDRKKKTEEYQKEVAEYEKSLGCEWENYDATKHGSSITDFKTIEDKGCKYDFQWRKYSLTSTGYIHLFHHINNDWWNDYYSKTPAPAHVVAEAEKIRAQQEAEKKRKAEEWEEAKKHRIYVHYTCPRCNRQVYVPKATADSKQSARCAKCHTGKKATEATTVEMQRKEEVEFQHIPAGAEIL